MLLYTNTYSKRGNTMQQATLNISSSDNKRIAAIAELVVKQRTIDIDGEAIYNAIEDAGNPVVEGYDLESWYDNCGEECYAGNLEEEDAHELCMQVKEQVFELIMLQVLLILKEHSRA